MKTNSSNILSELKKQAAKIKINQRLDSIVDTPFFKKKMDKGRRMLTAQGLPK